MQHSPAAPEPTGGGPLTGLRVIEMAGIGPCPFAAMLLSDMGADVVRIGRPDAAAIDERDFVLRGRRHVTLDLKSPGGVEALMSLIRGADVLIEGYRPGVMERLGLGPEAALVANPRLIYGRITGWGQSGPLAQTAGHDINYIAVTGALAAIGTADGPPVPPLNLVGDYGGGAMYLLTGILAALFEQRRSGRGQVIDAAMVDGAASLMSPLYAWRSMGMWPAERGNNLLDGGAPYYGTYRCADGNFLAIGCMEHPFFAEMLRLMGLTDPAFAERDDRAQWPRLRKLLEAAFLERTRAEWRELLENSDACCVPVLTMSEAPEHPHIAARRTFMKWNGEPAPAPAPRFSRTPSAMNADSSPRREEATVVLNDWSES